METVKHPDTIQILPRKNSEVSNSRVSNNTFSLLFNKQAASFESARFGWMAMAITLQSCLGSVACMFIQQNNASVFMLIACAGLTMGSNAMFISLAPPKWCVASFYLSLFVNTVFILINV